MNSTKDYHNRRHYHTWSSKPLGEGSLLVVRAYFRVSLSWLLKLICIYFTMEQSTCEIRQFGWGVETHSGNCRGAWMITYLNYWIWPNKESFTSRKRIVSLNGSKEIEVFAFWEIRWEIIGRRDIFMFRLLKARGINGLIPCARFIHHRIIINVVCIRTIEDCLLLINYCYVWCFIWLRRSVNRRFNIDLSWFICIWDNYNLYWRSLYVIV